jgi:outer membrane protein OmpA-like peptidoglycan-associated protein
MPVNYHLKITDNTDMTVNSAPKQFEIELISLKDKRTLMIDDYVIEKFSLVLFDFDKSDILGNNTKIIQLIKTRVGPSSIVEIMGYTDRTGDDDYNQRLSESRAKNTEKHLNLPNTIAKGVGEQILLYNNEIPEGRFYCRTVEIIVKTKVIRK